jgi:hypothetical protein
MFYPTISRKINYPMFIRVISTELLVVKESVFYELPVSSELGYNSFTTEIGGKRLDFTFKYNRRAGLWSMTIADDDGDIVSGRFVVLGVDLIGQYVDSRLPAGSIMAVNWDEGQKGVECGENDLGSRVKVYYMQEEPLS